MRQEPEARWSVSHLPEDLDLGHITGALAYHRQAELYEAMMGNMRLMEEISDHRRTLFLCCFDRAAKLFL